MPAETFVQSGQAGMRQNWRPAHAEAVTESKHSNYNLDLKINSRRGTQDSLSAPVREANIKKQGSEGDSRGAKLCQHPLCREDTVMQLLTVREGE